MHEEISILRAEAKVFSEEGGDVCLFWAGQMSELVRKLFLASLGEMDATAMLLKVVRREYDDSILRKLRNTK